MPTIEKTAKALREKGYEEVLCVEDIVQTKK